MKKESLNMLPGGGGPAEPVLYLGSGLSYGEKISAKGGERLNRCAFTMAEILLSLTIIGVVAAITLPSLTGNINERTWNTQRKALYARMSQAIALMPSLNGYGTLTEGENAQDTAAETFITEGLSKVLKINNICDADHLSDCGIPDKIIPLDGGTSNGGPINLDDIKTLSGLNSNMVYYKPNENNYDFYYSQTDTKVAAFETLNGESILVYYNPNCYSLGMHTNWLQAPPDMCANFVYDLNGNKGPNTVGKDIGVITALYATDSVVVAPMPLTRIAGNTDQENASRFCTTQDSESRLPTIDELSSMFYNLKLFGMYEYYYRSSSKADSGHYWQMEMPRAGIRVTTQDANTNYFVQCIKR